MLLYKIGLKEHGLDPIKYFYIDRDIAVLSGNLKEYVPIHKAQGIWLIWRKYEKHHSIWHEIVSLVEEDITSDIQLQFIRCNGSYLKKHYHYDCKPCECCPEKVHLKGISAEINNATTEA